MSIVSMKQLLEAGVHFGHQTRRWNPRMSPYIFTQRNGIYIIDLQKTLRKVNEAYQFIREVALDGKHVLFVGTKKQAQESIKEEALRSGSYYVNTRFGHCYGRRSIFLFSGEKRNESTQGITIETRL